LNLFYMKDYCQLGSVVFIIFATFNFWVNMYVLIEVHFYTERNSATVLVDE